MNLTKYKNITASQDHSDYTNVAENNERQQSNGSS
jgi:hypothetical protein